MTTKTYGALNPEQLARLFEMRANIAKRQALSAVRKVAKHECEAEAKTWAEAAWVVRNTEFVGWNDSMFKVADASGSE